MFYFFILERDLWKQKYLLSKKKTTALEERIQKSMVQIYQNIYNYIYIFFFYRKINLLIQMLKLTKQKFV